MIRSNFWRIREKKCTNQTMTIFSIPNKPVLFKNILKFRDYKSIFMKIKVHKGKQTHLAFLDFKMFFNRTTISMRLSQNKKNYQNRIRLLESFLKVCIYMHVYTFDLYNLFPSSRIWADFRQLKLASSRVYKIWDWKLNTRMV